jgi:hypothetical protein
MFAWMNEVNFNVVNVVILFIQPFSQSFMFLFNLEVINSHYAKSLNRNRNRNLNPTLNRIKNRARLRLRARLRISFVT